MNKQLRILVAGALLVVPFAITVYVIWRVGTGLNELGRHVLPESIESMYGLGIVVVIAGIYMVGLLTHLWIFRWVVALLERFVSRVPGAKTIYESVRDLLKLFGGDAQRMGRAVLYQPPGTQMTMLAILTNEKPAGPGSAGVGKVAVYLPFSYMFGGITVYVSPEHLRDVDIPVERALKLCATAEVGSEGETAPPEKSQ